jgi:DHA1 family tetracycline resistance protein-like MFS transporter
VLVLHPVAEFELLFFLLAQGRVSLSSRPGSIDHVFRLIGLTRFHMKEIARGRLTGPAVFSRLATRIQNVSFFATFMPGTRNQLGIVFLTVFLDLVGFGIVLPLLPLYSSHFGASGFMIGAIMAIYSVMQFLFSPIWGAWSDRIGRRPLLLFSTAGSAISYAIFGFGSAMAGTTALLIFLGSRALAGVCGANITVAQACIADVTPPEKRSQRMALIGVAFGLGFILGPVIGGYSLHWYGLAGPGWVAAGLCFLNFIGAWTFLPESLRPNSDHAPRRPRIAQWIHTLTHPKIGLLVGVFFLSTFCFTCFEVTIGLLVSRNFGLDFRNGADAKTITYLFAYCGVIGVIVQGGLIGRMVKWMGEPRLIALSLVLTAGSLTPLPFLHAWPSLLAALAMLALGSGLTRAPVFGLISNLTAASEQGATIGVAQSAGSLARIAGPLFAATLFQRHPASPYLAAGALAFFTAFLVWQSLVVEKVEPAIAR